MAHRVHVLTNIASLTPSQHHSSQTWRALDYPSHRRRQPTANSPVTRFRQRSQFDRFDFSQAAVKHGVISSRHRFDARCAVRSAAGIPIPHCKSQTSAGLLCDIAVLPFVILEQSGADNGSSLGTFVQECLTFRLRIIHSFF